MRIFEVASVLLLSLALLIEILSFVVKLIEFKHKK